MAQNIKPFPISNFICEHYNHQLVDTNVQKMSNVKPRLFKIHFNVHKCKEADKVYREAEDYILSIRAQIVKILQKESIIVAFPRQLIDGSTHHLWDVGYLVSVSIEPFDRALIFTIRQMNEHMALQDLPTGLKDILVRSLNIS